MKRLYEYPCVVFLSCCEECILAASGVRGYEGGNKEIDYGGIDEEGGMEPAANIINVWDSEW